MASWSDKVAQVTQNAISKGKEVAGVTKLNVEIGALNQDIRNIQTKVGAYVLSNGLLPEDSFVAGLAEKVQAYKTEIEAKNEKIMELKNITVCAGCGREVSRDNKYCVHCGAEIVVKASASDKAQNSEAETVAEGAAVVSVGNEVPAGSSIVWAEIVADNEDGAGKTAPDNGEAAGETIQRDEAKAADTAEESAGAASETADETL